jgi:hypothetical protein
MSTAAGFLVMLHVLGSLFHLLGFFNVGYGDEMSGPKTWLTETKAYAGGPPIASLHWSERYLYSVSGVRV